MTILLYIYLTGFVGTSAYFAKDCQNPHPVQYKSKSECYKSAAVVGSIWPVSGTLAFLYKDVH